MKNLVIFTIVAGSLFFSSIESFASFPHAPHDENSEVTVISCAECHLDKLPLVDRSDVCFDCHDGNLAVAMADHSAAIIHTGEDPATWPYGNWETVCLDCHDPHLHYQLDYFSQSGDALFLITGTIITMNFLIFCVFT